MSAPVVLAGSSSSEKGPWHRHSGGPRGEQLGLSVICASLSERSEGAFLWLSQPKPPPTSTVGSQGPGFDSSRRRGSVASKVIQHGARLSEISQTEANTRWSHLRVELKKAKWGN